MAFGASRFRVLSTAARSSALAALLAGATAAGDGPAGGGTLGPTVLVATAAQQPSVVVAPDGAVHVAMLRGGNVVVATSRDGGSTFADPVVALDAQGFARGGRQRGPRIGADRNGRLLVTAFVPFDPAERARKYPAADLYVVSSTDGGRSWTKPIRVNEVEKKAPESLHSLAVSPSGVAFVAWLDRRDRQGKGQDLWIARVDGGTPRANRKVAEEVCECCAPGLAVDVRGHPTVVWREGADKESREVLMARSADGGETFSRPLRVNRTDTQEGG